MIELKEVNAGYNGEVKVRGANIVFETGEVTSIIGPNGCGKTTLLNIIARLMRPYSGQLLVDGVDVNTIGKKRYAQMVSILPQIRTVPNITVKSLVSHGRFPYLSFPRRLSKDDVEIVERSMEITGTISLRNRYVTVGRVKTEGLHGNGGCPKYGYDTFRRAYHVSRYRSPVRGVESCEKAKQRGEDHSYGPS